MIFDDIIIKELQGENSELEYKLENAIGKIDRFELEISKKKINKKFEKYSSIFNKMLDLQMKMSKIKNEISDSFKEVDESVTVISNINNIQKYVKQGDDLLEENLRLSKQSYSKALRLSERLLGISVISNEDVDYIKSKIEIVDSISVIEFVKNTMVSINQFITKKKDLNGVIYKLGKVDFSKMNNEDLSQVNDLILNVLENQPSRLGDLVKSLKDNDTNTNKIELKLS